MNEYWLAGTVTASILAAVSRFFGAILFSIPKHRIITQPYGWVLSVIGAWIALAIAGIWVPAWMPLLLGIVIAVAAGVNQRNRSRLESATPMADVEFFNHVPDRYKSSKSRPGILSQFLLR